MAVTYKIEDKAKKQIIAAGPPPDLADYELAGERSEGTKAFIIWMLFILIASIGLSVNPYTMGFGIGIFVWWLLSCIVYFMIAPRMVLRRLRMHGAEYEITAKKQPRLKTLLAKASAMLGLGEPEGFLVNEQIPQIRILGGKNNSFIVITQGAVDLLQPSELDTLVLRCLVHARQGHVRRLMLLQFVNDTPPAVRIFAWPVVLYARMLSFNWHDMAAQTADRLTLLLMKNHKLLLSALLKLHASTDPIMQASNITPQDVDNYIRQGSFIGLEGAEISTQYRIGSAVHENPYLEERMQALNRWADSDEYDAALEKLAAARAGKTPTVDTSANGAAGAAPNSPTAANKP